MPDKRPELLVDQESLKAVGATLGPETRKVTGCKCGRAAPLPGRQNVNVAGTHRCPNCGCKKRGSQDQVRTR